MSYRRNRFLFQHAGVLDIVSRLVGEEVRMIQDMALVKSANIGSEKPWHQDLAYFDWHPVRAQFMKQMASGDIEAALKSALNTPHMPYAPSVSVRSSGASWGAQ